MKKIIINMTIWCAFAAMITSCTKIDSKYEKFIVPGGRTYAGRIIGQKAYSGHNRIKVAWLKSVDPNVVKSRIFWDNYNDSVEVITPATGDSVIHIFENMAEKSYTFMIRNYNKNGNASVAAEVFGTSYGDNYESSLLNRFLNSSETENSGALNIQWGPANTSGGMIATEVKYTSTNGSAKTAKFDIADVSSKIPDYKSGTVVQYRTLYRPDSTSIDVFYTGFVEKKVSERISQTGWTATASSEELTAQLPNGAPNKAIDGSTDTYWHSNHTVSITGYPYWLAVDMKKPITVTRIELFSRKAYFTEDFTDFTFQGSMDGTNWTSYGAFNMEKLAVTQSFIINGAPTLRYARIYMTKGVTVHAYLSEFTVFGY